MKKAFWSLIFIAIVLSIPSLMERSNVESSNSTYETVIPFSDIKAMTDTGLPIQDVLTELKKANLQSIAFEPLSLKDLAEMQLIQILDKAQFFQEHPNDRSSIPKETGFLIEIYDKSHPLVHWIPRALNSNSGYTITLKEIKVGDRLYLYVPYANKDTLTKPITFDTEAIQLVKDQHFSIVTRLENNFNDKDNEHPIFQQIDQFRESKNHLLFIGKEVVGFSKQENGQLQEMANRIMNWNMNVVLIENSPQKGLNKILKTNNYSLVRLHSVSLGKKIEDKTEVINRSIRAIKERNIQLLYLNVLSNRESDFFNNETEARETLNELTNFLSKLQVQSGKIAGIATPIKNIEQPFWFKIILILAASGFVGIAGMAIHKRLAFLGVIVTLIMLSIGFLLRNETIIQLIALIIAILSPLYALSTIKTPRTFKDTILSFGKIIGITLIGAWFVITLLYGWDYLVKIQSFRGVKILAILPVALMAIKLTGYKWLTKQVQFWHVIAALLITGLGMFYLGRTGNSGIVLPYELELRQWLESTLGVRPRTKELIGFPLLFFSLFLLKEGYQQGKYLLIPGAIACSSLIGTFTHLHTPLIVSLQRSILSVLIGLALGMALSVIWKVIKRHFYRLNKERYTTWKL